MAVFHPHKVKCVCGEPLVAQLADSINTKRVPQWRERILQGRLHKARCSVCGREMTVEKPFYYTDATRKSFFKVLPRGERHRWRQASEELEVASALVPDDIWNQEQRSLRVVFGLDELREKLVAEDAGLDDRILELLKVLLVYEHPVLLRRARLRLMLEAVTDSVLRFRAAYEHHPQRFSIAMPRALAGELSSRRGELEAWVHNAHKREPIFELSDHWVNMWRWSPQPSALAQLKACAAQIRDGEQVATGSKAFRRMLKGLPRGNHLPSWAKKDLRELFEFSKQNDLQQLEEALFEIRFGIELENDWADNKDPDDIDTLWQLLKDLPATNVEGNTRIHEILLDDNEGGGWYSPESHDIAIGSEELVEREGFGGVIRHEVGHAVHELNEKLVDHWLGERFGWQTFSANAAGINAWVKLMGGWGDVTTSQRAQVREYLLTALGSGDSWGPGPTPSVPKGHPWHRPEFGPRLAFEKSGTDWYGNFKTWHRSGKHAFFLNYWYATLMAVDVSCLDLISKMPDDYAAMSHSEFFAELYALHYDLGNPKRAKIPADVGKWLDKHIGAAKANAPRPARPRPKREGRTRPRV